MRRRSFVARAHNREPGSPARWMTHQPATPAAEKKTRTHSAKYDDVGLDLDTLLSDDLVALDVDDRVVLQKGDLGVVESLVVSAVKNTTLYVAKKLSSGKR